MNPPTVHQISQCFIKPNQVLEESKHPLHLSPWDLAMLSVNYIQKGLLFQKPNSPNYSITPLLQTLKSSLSKTLIHFYPLAGRLKTQEQTDPHLYCIFIDCVNSPGAKFVHAAVDLTVKDVISPADVPAVVQELFDHDRMINYDGHVESLLTVKVTELVDGIFVGVSINHMVVDGTSYWNFFKAWSQVFKAQDEGLGNVNLSY